MVYESYFSADKFSKAFTLEKSKKNTLLFMAYRLIYFLVYGIWRTPLQGPDGYAYTNMFAKKTKSREKDTFHNGGETVGGILQSERHTDETTSSCLGSPSIALFHCIQTFPAQDLELSVSTRRWT